jgi:carbon-monoxide dehydrogenase small subunit
MNKRIELTVNGETRSMDINVGASLLDVLRKDLGLTGTKEGCSVGECGACTVLVDGVNVDSCIYMAVWADGCEIRTIEDLDQDGVLSPVQQAFIDNGAVQCGFCTPGIVLTTTALRESGAKMTRDELRRSLSGHLCRCTGYQQIVVAAEKSLDAGKE